MKHLLVPIGSSENAKNTLQYAIDFAQVINAKVFVFRAYSVITKAGTIINISDIIQRETNLYMRTIVSSVETKGVDIKLITAKFLLALVAFMRNIIVLLILRILN